MTEQQRLVLATLALEQQIIVGRALGLPEPTVAECLDAIARGARVIDKYEREPEDPISPASPGPSPSTSGGGAGGV